MNEMRKENESFKKKFHSLLRHTHTHIHKTLLLGIELKWHDYSSYSKLLARRNYCVQQRTRHTIYVYISLKLFIFTNILNKTFKHIVKSRFIPVYSLPLYFTFWSLCSPSGVKVGGCWLKLNWLLVCFFVHISQRNK